MVFSCISVGDFMFAFLLPGSDCFFHNQLIQLFLLDDAIFLSLGCTPSQAEMPDVILVLFPGVSHCHQETLVTHLDERRVTRSCIPIYCG